MSGDIDDRNDEPHISIFKASHEDLSGAVPDTIHFISPATTERSEHEGDFDYHNRYRQICAAYPTVPCPSKESSSISCEDNELQRTVIIVKPDALPYKEVILRAINHEELHIIDERLVHLTPEQTSELYFQHYGYPSFPHIVVNMSQSPVLALSVYGVNAVERVKQMVGPQKALREEWFYPRSMKIKYGLNYGMSDALHTSNNIYEAAKENRYFFPEDIVEPIVADKDKFEDYFNLNVKPTLVNACAELVRVKPVEPIIYLAEWLLLNNIFKPRMPPRTAMTPT